MSNRTSQRKSSTSRHLKWVYNETTGVVAMPCTSPLLRLQDPRIVFDTQVEALMYFLLQVQVHPQCDPSLLQSVKRKLHRARVKSNNKLTSALV